MAMTRDRWLARVRSESDASLLVRFSADNRGALLAAMLMMLIGWGGLAHLVTATRPRIGGEIWLFFALLQIAVTGTSIPFWRFLSLYFVPAGEAAPPAGVIARRGIWTGMLAVACAWLLIPRALSLPIVLILALFLVAVELILRSRERANA